MSLLKLALKYPLGWVNVARMFKWRGNSWRYRDKPFFIFDGRTYTFGDTWKQAVRYAHLLDRRKEQLVEAGELERGDQLPVAIYSDNRPEFLFTYFATALTGDVLFALNTGFRGEMLARLLNDAGARLLITERAYLEEVERLDGMLETLDAEHIGLIDPPVSHDFANIEDLLAAARPPRRAHKPPRSGLDNTAPFLIIYTSGTTGLPKGVTCSQWKLTVIGFVLPHKIGLRGDDRGYLTMPLFHSNAFFLGVMPSLWTGGSFLLKRKFSASAFEPDVLEHGCTYMNYVGQPVHYILSALEKKHGSPEAVEQKLADHPRNEVRLMVGNGASAVDREKMMRYLGMEHIYELYGSTEAAISTINQPGDPIESLGQVGRKVVILDEHDEECPPGRIENGRLVNYDEAVGEICKKLPRVNIFFDGYFKNPEATNKKYRDGYYRSGDLGHVRIIDGNRHLFFNGRTDDWIRKDGENFSADHVAEVVSEHPQDELACAYGVPSPVSDEKVMAAVQLDDGDRLDPQQLFDFFDERQQAGAMDPKWFPDFVRVVDEFDMTRTQKIKVRSLKGQHFNLDKSPEMEIYYRERGDTAFKRLTAEEYQGLKEAFVETGREAVLENY